MAHDICAEEGICLAVLRYNRMCQPFIKELIECLNTLGPGDLRHICRWFNAHMSHTRAGHVLKHDAVIAADFHDEGISRLKIIPAHTLSQGLEMLSHVGGSGREKCVIFME